MLRLLLLFTTVFICGCDPLYVTRAAYEHSKILLAKEPIVEKLSSQEISERNGKLANVLAARSYAESIGLDPKGSFLYFSEVPRDELAWVLIASRPDKFSIVTWWYPIVGSVPYKGFFTKSDAEKNAKGLEQEGYETSIRGTDAISTLGWFDDPVLSTTIRRDLIRIVDTVIHESLHSTVWIPGHVDFNESLANVLGTIGAAQFFLRRSEWCEGECDLQKRFRDSACRSITFMMDFGRFIETLYLDLEQLYSEDLPREQVLIKRQAIFEAHRDKLKATYPTVSVFDKLNNAELMQFRLYYKSLDRFFLLFKKYNYNISSALEELRNIRDQVSSSKTDPFALLPESGTSSSQDFQGDICQNHLPID